MHGRLAVLVIGLSLLCLGASVEVSEKSEKALTPDEIQAEMKKVREEVEKLRREHSDVFNQGDSDKNGMLSSAEFFAVRLLHLTAQRCLYCY